MRDGRTRSGATRRSVTKYSIIRSRGPRRASASTRDCSTMGRSKYRSASTAANPSQDSVVPYRISTSGGIAALSPVNPSRGAASHGADSACRTKRESRSFTWSAGVGKAVIDRTSDSARSRGWSSGLESGLHPVPASCQRHDVVIERELVFVSGSRSDRPKSPGPFKGVPRGRDRNPNSCVVVDLELIAVDSASRVRKVADLYVAIAEIRQPRSDEDRIADVNVQPVGKQFVPRLAGAAVGALRRP